MRILQLVNFVENGGSGITKMIIDGTGLVERVLPAARPREVVFRAGKTSDSNGSDVPHDASVCLTV